MALSAANTTLQLLDSAEAAGSKLYNTALVCIAVAIVVFIIIVYMISTSETGKKEGLANGEFNPEGATTVMLSGDFRGDDPQILYKYYKGESLDRTFNAQIRSGTVKTGDHTVQIWSITGPTSINSNLYTYLRNVNSPDMLERLNPAMFKLLADIPPHTEIQLSVTEPIDKIRLRVVPI